MRVGVEESGDVNHARENVLQLLGDLVPVDLMLGEVAEVVDSGAFDDCIGRGRSAKGDMWKDKKGGEHSMTIARFLAQMT